MKKKIRKVWDSVVFIYGICSIIVAIFYLYQVGMGVGVHANAARAVVWFGLGLLVISNYIPKKEAFAEQRLYFNQWVEYDSYEDYQSGRGGTTNNYSGVVIQTENSLTISYQDKFGVKTTTYMRSFNDENHCYVGLSDEWIVPMLEYRCMRINKKFIRLNLNQALITK
jgi:hypothetical protein